MCSLIVLVETFLVVTQLVLVMVPVTPPLVFALALLPMIHSLIVQPKLVQTIAVVVVLATQILVFAHAHLPLLVWGVKLQSLVVELWLLAKFVQEMEFVRLEDSVCVTVCHLDNNHGFLVHLISVALDNVLVSASMVPVTQQLEFVIAPCTLIATLLEVFAKLPMCIVTIWIFHILLNGAMQQ